MFISLLSIWVTSPMHHYLLLVFVHLPRIINTNLHMEAYLCRSWLPSSSVCVLKWHKWPESCPPVRPAWWERRTEGPARHPWRKDACLLPPPPHPRVFLERSLFRIHWSRPARWSSTAPQRSTSWQERGNNWRTGAGKWAGCMRSRTNLKRESVQYAVLSALRQRKWEKSK